MIALIVKLLIAHILGDFVLQPDKWVADKKSKTYKSRYFYLHGLVHLLALLVLLEFDRQYWISISLLVLSHLIIDLLKVMLKEKVNARRLFAVDQVLHLIIIGVVASLHFSLKLELNAFYSPEFLLFVLAILNITSVSSVLMKMIMSKWELKEDKSEDSLKNAGKYIGILERLFVFGFIILNQWSAIGLLIAAKSIFRFSDLTRAKDRKLTEYILIGTLISFGLAITTGVGYKFLLNYISY